MRRVLLKSCLTILLDNSRRVYLKIAQALRSSLKRLKEHRLKAAFLIIFIVISIVPAINIMIVKAVDSRVYMDATGLPENDVGLVLGTAPRLSKTTANPHFVARIETAARLYHTGKVKHLLLSGDNHTKGYNEPTAMKRALMAKGVPEAAMTLDSAGLRTLDSVVRAKEVFEQTRLTIITDDFHAHRAVFLATHYGIDAVACSSKRIPFRWSANSRIREYGARVKAALDLYVLNTRPKHLGDKIEIHAGSQTE